ncbi:hypothetical protein ABZS59_35490 [Streptomyces flaveolus]
MISNMPDDQHRYLSSGQREVVQASDAEHDVVDAVAIKTSFPLVAGVVVLV